MSASCAAAYYPELPGPADKAKCTLARENGLVGTYTCEFTGQYQLKPF